MDELDFWIHPLILGHGTPLFRPGKMQTLRLTSIDRRPLGVVGLSFGRDDGDKEA